jgi:hypothetical protein
VEYSWIARFWPLVDLNWVRGVSGSAAWFLDCADLERILADLKEKSPIQQERGHDKLSLSITDAGAECGTDGQLKYQIKARVERIP